MLRNKRKSVKPPYVEAPEEEATERQEYADIEELLIKSLRDDRNAFKEHSVSLRFECELAAILRSAKTQESANVGDSIYNTLSNHVTIVSSDTGARGGQTEAVACIDFMKRRWGFMGEQLLKDTSRLSEEGLQEVKCTLKQDDQTELTYTLALRQASIHVRFGDYISHDRLKDFANALSWLCKALRSPRPQELSHGLYLSTSTCRMARFTYSTRLTEDTARLTYKLFIEFSLLSEPYHAVENSCWQELFKSCYVLKDKVIGSLDFPGKGIEVPFDLMTSLAAIEYPVLVNGGTVLAGYQTVLFPTQMEPTYVQFHLEFSEDGQINPFEIDYAQRVHVTDYARFKHLRCFLGWCDPAHIQLGTKNLPLTVNYSDAREKARTLQRSGVSTGFQFTSASPVQAGINGQISYSFVSHCLRFEPSSAYSKMLNEKSRDVVLISDVHARRSWLVPSLSLMLHMAHVWVAQMPSPSGPDPIPFVVPHDDELGVITALEGQGDLVVCGRGSDSFTLRRLLMGLSINLLASVDRKARSTKKILYGFELMDLISEPGRGGFMKELKFRTKQSWLPLANLADAVIVCSNLGEVIIRVHDECRNNGKCNLLPCGNDYLAAHLACIGRLMDRAGGDTTKSNDLGKISLSPDIQWTVSGDPFEPCGHDCYSADTCWARNLQNLDRDRVFRFKRSNQDQSGIPRSKISNMKGAVVFGKYREKADEVLLHKLDKRCNMSKMEHVLD